MNKHIYLKSTMNPNYIQKVLVSDYMANPRKYPYMIPLTGDAEKAEQVYENKIKNNEWKLRGQAFLSGATAGLYDAFGLNDEERILLGKYKQRSSIGGVFDFLGTAGSLVATGGVGRAVVGGAVKTGLARAGLTAGAAVRGTQVGGALVGEAAGITGYTATQRMAELVGEGKDIDIPQAVEIGRNEFVKNVAITGTLWGGFKALGMGARQVGKVKDKILKVAGIGRKTQRGLEKEYAAKTWGVKAERADITRPERVLSDVAQESNKIIKRIAAKKDPKTITLGDLESSLRSTTRAVGKVFDRVLKVGDENFYKGLSSDAVKRTTAKFVNTLESIKEFARLKGAGTQEVKKIIKAFEHNMFRVVRSDGKPVRVLREEPFKNLNATVQYVGDLLDKAAKAGRTKRVGVLSQIYKSLRELQKSELGRISGKLSATEKMARKRYSTLKDMELGIIGRITGEGIEQLAPATFRDVARAGIMGTGAAIGIGGLGGTSVYIAGSAAGQAATSVARSGFQAPWRISIYPSIAQQANRFLSGGKFLPDVFARNLQETAVRRSGFLRRLYEGVKEKGAMPARVNIIQKINQELSLEEKRDFYTSLRNTSLEVINDPQKLNQVGMGAAEVFAQAGGSAFSVQMQMGAMQAMKQVVDSFPKDRQLPRADDLMQKKNLWSKKDVKMIGDRMEVFFEPDDVMERAVSGSADVSLDQIQYIKFMYPEYFRAVRSAIIMGLNNGNLKLSQAQKTRLSYLFKLPIKISTHPKMMNISEQIGNLGLARHAGQKEQVRKNLNVERKADSLKTAAERSLLNEDQA